MFGIAASTQNPSRYFGQIAGDRRGRSIVFATILLLGTSSLYGCGFFGASEATKKALVLMQLDKSGAGRVTFEKATITGSTAEFTKATILVADGLEIPVDKIRFKNLGLSKDKTAGPVFSSLELDGIHYALSGVPGVSAKVDIDKISLQKPNAATAQWYATLFKKDGPAQLLDIQLLGFAGAAIEGVKANFKGKDEVGSGSLTIASMRVSELNRLAAKSSTAQGFDLQFDAENIGAGFVKLASAESTGLTLEPWRESINYLLTIAQNPSADLPNLSQNFDVIGKYGPLESGFDTYALKGLDFQVGGIKGDLASVSAKTTRNKDRIATALTAESAPLNLAPFEVGPYGAPFKMFLDEFGYKNLSLATKFAASFDPASDLYSMRDFEISMPMAFKANFGADLGGLQAGAKAALASTAPVEEAGVPGDPRDQGFAAAQARQATFLEKMSLKRFAMTFSDDSLFNRSITVIAKRSKKTPDQLMQELRAQLAAIKPQPETPVAEAKLMTTLAGAFKQFADKAYSQKKAVFKFGLHPKTPFTLATLSAGPGSVDVNSLNITASAE